MPRQLVRDFGTCLRFDGVDDEILITSPTALQTSVFTYTAWVKPSTSVNQAIIGDSKGSGTRGPEFRCTSANKIELLEENVASIGTSTGSIIPKQWNFVAVSYDVSGNYAFYINGVAAGSGTNLRTLQHANKYIGRQLTAEFFLGLIDDVRIYNSALTSTEIINLYYGINPSSTPVGWYKFDEGSGTTATDSGSGAVNGVITGATYSTDVFIKPRTAAGNRTSLNNFSAAGNPITNLVINPSFETNNSNYSTENGSSLARITTDGRFGSCCGELTSTSSAFSRIFRNITLVGTDKGKRAVLSLYAKAGTSTNAHIEIGFSGSGTAGNLAITGLTSEWVRYSVSVTVPTNATGHIIYVYAKTKNTAEAGTIYFDGVQFEVLPIDSFYTTYPTDYCDGTQTNCSWTGAAHGSTSTRSTNVARISA